MKNIKIIYNKVFPLIILLVLFIFINSCKKIKELDQDPEIEPLTHGFKASAAIGYCASLTSTVFKGGQLPDNVIFQTSSNDEYTSAGTIFVNITESNPLPFNNNIGQIIIGGIWDDNDNCGVITIIFADIDILSGKYKFYGIHTVPVIEMEENGNILTLFAEQDIIIGEGSDTIINLNLSRPQFNFELARLDSEQPEDVFIAVKQNVWFINIDQKNTLSDIYDDSFIINGGGQILEVASSSGGILYHAMIQTEFIYSTCSKNPLNGVAFIQNLKAGTEIDLGNIVLNFHEACDGKAYVEVACGKYLSCNGKNVNLNLN
ncbi:MAG: hypothetical protein KAT68_14585 [Bacteroidales bacterium]|nr:hypothetical protein [Bacteroidales bacterium]